MAVSINYGKIGNNLIPAIFRQKSAKCQKIDGFSGVQS